MSGNESVLKKSGYSEKKGIISRWRMLLGYAALLVVNLITPLVLASSSTGLGETSHGGFAIEASAFSINWSKVAGSEITSQTLVESQGASTEITPSTLVWLITILAAVPMLMVILEAIAALAFRQRKPVVTPIKPFPHTVVLIPAHNEESVIARCLASLAVDRPPNTRLLCVAHNCTDATAEVARRLGAEVVEVHDQGQGGKPDALKAGLRYLDANPPEVVVIVDADCVVSEGAVRLLATRAFELNRPVMGAYFFAPAEAGQGVATLSSLAVLLKNYVRPLGLHALGLPCLLNGSGSAYPFHAIRNIPHGKGSIAEDYQLAIDLLQRGYPTTFVPQARIDGQLPKRADTALGQRRRWEHGHMFLAFRTAPKLLLEGLLHLDKNRLGLALEVAVPPLAFLGLMWGVAVSLALALYAVAGDAGPLGFLAGTAFAFGMAVLLSWMRFAGVKATVAALAAVPSYLVWKLPMYRDFFTRREKRWMKTARDSFHSAQHGLRAPLSGGL